MHLVTIDRLPVEVNVLCFWAVLGTAGGLNLALMGELLNGTNDMSILLVPSILFLSRRLRSHLNLRCRSCA